MLHYGFASILLVSECLLYVCLTLFYSCYGDVYYRTVYNTAVVGPKYEVLATTLAGH